MPFSKFNFAVQPTYNASFRYLLFPQIGSVAFPRLFGAQYITSEKVNQATGRHKPSGGNKTSWQRIKPSHYASSEHANKLCRRAVALCGAGTHLGLRRA